MHITQGKDGETNMHEDGTSLEWLILCYTNHITCSSCIVQTDII